MTHYTRKLKLRSNSGREETEWTTTVMLDLPFIVERNLPKP